MPPDTTPSDEGRTPARAAAGRLNTESGEPESNTTLIVWPSTLAVETT